ncbi:KICSTOR complex protein SZT2 isoform X5 [Tachysurus vachellii]|uniref:KICSTOR complex protein SZT2 isoform X5 n=1 Tax=Tachysurus vachellii TaxID=175792 RepID=UPI00296AE9A4|nr:KICSTOR complex protein SZT2 isoform X5 [Tachysurus vachellii]
MAEKQDNEVEEADQVYLLMNENYHISRNVRLSWFLNRLNQVIKPSPKCELLTSDKELNVLSILPKGWQPDSPPSMSPYLLVPSTQVTFVARRYRFVIELDLSPSTGIVDDSTGEVIFDEVFHALSRCLAGLAAQFTVPGTDFLFQPEIFITILAYSSIVGLSSHQVLVQGCRLHCADLDQFLHQIYQQLRALENNIAEVLQQQHKQCNRSIPADTTEDLTQWKQSISMGSSDVGLVSMVRQGILALQLLPSNSSAGIIIITDGVMSVPDISVCETLLNQLRSGTVACSFVQVGAAYSYDCSFGYVPNVELMKFISMATFGSYLSLCPDPVQVEQEMNSYHRSFLTYSFIHTNESINPDYYCFSQHRLFNEHLVSASGNPALGLRRKKHTEKEVHADLISVLSVRLREGYTIRDISFTKGGTHLEVQLVLLWKHNMRIEYVAVSSWPLLLAERSTWMEVTMEGSYDILHDLSCTLRKPITSPYRTAVIRRFWNTLHGINQTDQMLVHLQSFNSIPEHYTIPESTKNGVPLFYIPPGSTAPVLSLQHSGSKDSSHSQFASYWKPILSMDANVWQRWLHMHRIAIILEHDVPVPKHVHSAGSNGRFSTIQCRIAHSALTSLLRDWSSFVLVEGYSYVKFIYSTAAYLPISFYLVRLISKAPCMVLRLGFPIGTPAHTRHKIVDELREQILKLRFPHRVQNKEATPKTKRKNLGNASPSKSPPLPAPKPALSDRPCVVIFNKPLEKLLIRYEKLPTDFRTPFMLNLESLGHPLSVATSRTSSSTMAFLSQYFLQQRWVWTMQSGPGGVVSLHAVAHILSTLAEIRLSEGFHFAASGEGIVNMVLELPMAVKTPKGSSALQDTQQHTCIVQYVLFPPHSTSTKDSFSTDDDNDTEVEAIDVDTELNLVTECWVEPQSGSVLSHSEQQRHFHNLSYQDIPQAIFPRDQSCMSTLLTFEYLIQLCKNKDQPQPLSNNKDATGETPGATPADGIHMVPFQFDLMTLLPRCQQIELFFYTFSKAENEDALQNAPSLHNDLLLSLFHASLQNELSDREITLADGDHMEFMNHILERERDGHVAPFSLPVIKEEGLKPTERHDAVLSFHTVGSSKEVTGSTSTLQSCSNTDLVDEEPVVMERERLSPQWKCYAKHISAQQVLLIFLPATYTDVQILMSFGLDLEPQVNGACDEDEEETLSLENNQSQSVSLSSSMNGPLAETESVMEESDGQFLLAAEILSGELEDKENHHSEQTPTVSSVEEKDSVQFSEPQKHEYHHQLSQQSGGDVARPRCPVYIYNCCMDLLKDQLLQQHSNRRPKDIFVRSQDALSWELNQQQKSRSFSQERSSASSWSELITHQHKQKELANYCSLLQEHYCQSYVRGVFRSLQMAYSISSQDVLTAMDYCEESLQEIDITSFLQTLCGHIRTFREQHEPRRAESTRKTLRPGATFTIGEEEDERTGRAIVELEDVSDVESKGKVSTPTSPEAPDEPRSLRVPEFPLSLLHSQQECEVYPNLHKIIQDKFMEIGAQHFKTVPSNPHYFFYCPQSSKKDKEDSDEERERRPSEDCDVSEAELATEDENVSGCCMVSESDTDLEVEYQDQANGKAEEGDVEEGAGHDSGSESNTVNQDEDSFSILDGDSVLEAPEPEMPPLFVHLVCSLGAKSCHGSMPIRTLPTCLGELISCLENAESLQSMDLNELSVTLDIFVLTLPLDIEVMASGINHIRYTSESSVSMNRSPGQPSSYRSDEELMENLDCLRGVGMDGMTGDTLSKLPVAHKQAVLATMDEIRWLLEDEIVSALRHSSLVDCSTLQKVADHVFRSSGRPGCHHELVPLQFVFGPEQSLEKFKEEFRRISFPGYLLNAEKQNFYYVSRRRQHSHRLQTARELNQNSAFSQGEKSVSQPSPFLPEVGSNLKTATNHSTVTKELDSEAELQEKEVESEQVEGGGEVIQHQTEEQKEQAEITEEDEDIKPRASNSASETLSEQIRAAAIDDGHSQSTNQQTGSSVEHKPPPKTHSGNSLESVQSVTHGSGKIRQSRVQSVVSSQGSVDSDMLGYDGGSSDSECDGPSIDDHEIHSPLMPDFWLIVQIQKDRLEVFSHSRSFIAGKETTSDGEEEEEEIPEYLRLHQLIVEEIGKICRKVNQRLLLQDLHDSHVCNSLLVGESEEDIWKNEPLYRQRAATSDDYNADESYQPRDYLAATMHFMPGHFACDVVWNTIIQIHPRLKMGPNMGVARAIQALRSVLSAFCVVNRKNMFVYQERTTKSVFYLRLSETSQAGPYSDLDMNLHVSRSLGLARSQEPLGSEDLTGSRSSLEGSRPVGQVDKHILLLVHGVGRAGPEITDELVKVLRKRLDEATLDIITVMLVRNCKLTPADVEFIQPPGSAPTEVMEFSLPQYSVPWIRALALYLRQNLLIFLHIPKYTDSNMEHHFKHYFHVSTDLPDSDIYLYNKPGGQGTGGKGTMSELVQNLFPPSQFQGIACIALSFVDAQDRPLYVCAQDGSTARGDAASISLQPEQFESLTSVLKIYSDKHSTGHLNSTWPKCGTVRVRFDIWEQGNVSPLQLTEKLRSALRHALCDLIMEMKVLPNPLCLETFCIPEAGQKDNNNSISPQSASKDVKESPRRASTVKSGPVPITLSSAPSSTPTTGANTPESTTPTGKNMRRSFWEILSKPDSSELGSPKTTDDIVQEKAEDSRVSRRRHKTESVKQQWSHERAVAVEREQAQRRHVTKLEEGDIGSLHPVYQSSFQPWVTYMAKLGCPSVQHCTAEIWSLFLLPSIITEVVNLVSSLAPDTAVKVFERTSSPQGDLYVPLSQVQPVSHPPSATRNYIIVGRSFQQWHYSMEQEESSDEENPAGLSRFTPHKGLQRFDALEHSDWLSPGQAWKGVAPRQRFLHMCIVDKKLSVYVYNWSVDVGASLSRDLVRLVQWQNARAHTINCLLSQKMGLFHHYCFADTPTHEDLKQQESNPFLSSTMEADALLRSPVPPVPSKDAGRLSNSGRGLPHLPFPAELVPFDEALRDVSAGRLPNQDGADIVARYGAQLLEVKATERRELEKQMKIENLFVTWQQRSAQSNMPISATDLDALKQSSRLVHYCATPLLFDQIFRKQIQDELRVQPQMKKRHRSDDSAASGRDRSHSTDSAELLPVRCKEEQEICSAFMQQYVQYLQSLGFILVQVRPPSPARSIARARAALLSSLSTEGRSSFSSFSYNKQKSEESPKQSSGSGTTTYHLQRALPGGVMLMELAFQGFYFCVKQYALECSRIPMGQTVNSQEPSPRSKLFPKASSDSDYVLSMLFTEECDKVRDLMHVHSFSYDFHLRVVHQYLLGCHMTLRQGYQLNSFLEDFISHHPDIPKFGRNHVFQGNFSMSTGMITAHQLYNYITDHAGTYGMKPLRMSKTAANIENKKGMPSADLHEYALVALWNSSGTYKDLEGLQHHDDFDVSLLVCHDAAPFEEQSEGERHLLRLRYYVIMTSQRELFPRLTADMRRFKKLPQIYRDPSDPSTRGHIERTEPGIMEGWKSEHDLWEETAIALTPEPDLELVPEPGEHPSGAESEEDHSDFPDSSSPLFPLLNSEVILARKQIQSSVTEAMAHCRRDNLWRRLFHGEHAAHDKLKLSKLAFAELEELLDSVQSRSIGEIDPQLECFLTMNPAWYQSLIKVLLSRFPQSCRHFVDDCGIQYLAVLNQKFTDCFVLVFLDSQAGKTSLKVVFREPLPPQAQPSSSPPPQLVSMYHHLESVINTACYNLWTGLL